MKRVGVFGAGYGAYCLIPAFQLAEGVEVTSITATSSERLAAAAQKYGVRNRFEDWRAALGSDEFDIAVLAVPPLAQQTIALSCLQRGLPVFAEKPLAVDLRAAEELSLTAKTNSVVTAVDFQFPEHPAWRKCKALLHQHELGKINYVVVTWTGQSFDNARSITGWKTNSAYGGGVVSHFGSHCLHYLEWFCGPFAITSANLTRQEGHFAPGETFANISFEFANGAVGAAILSNDTAAGIGHRLDFYCEEGRISLINANQGYMGFELSICRKGSDREEHVAYECDLPKLDAETDQRVAPVFRLAQRFIDAIRSGTEMKPSFSEGLKVQQLLNKISEISHP